MKANFLRQEKTNTTVAGMWSPRGAASYCGFKSAVTILRAFRRGELPGYKLNARTIRFHPRDVARWLNAARIETKGGAV